MKSAYDILTLAGSRTLACGPISPPPSSTAGSTRRQRVTVPLRRQRQKDRRRDMSANTIETSTLPYSLQQAVKNHPVTHGATMLRPCIRGLSPDSPLRAVYRASPHKEQSVKKRRAHGRPFLFVVSTPLKGF